METTLKNICTEHGLNAISVMVHNTDNVNHTSVFVHWAEGICVQGTAQTFDDALALALATKNEIIAEAA